LSLNRVFAVTHGESIPLPSGVEVLLMLLCGIPPALPTVLVLIQYFNVCRRHHSYKHLWHLYQCGLLFKKATNVPTHIPTLKEEIATFKQDNNEVTEPKSPPPPFAATKMTPNLALFRNSIKHDPSQFNQCKDVCEGTYIQLTLTDHKIFKMSSIQNMSLTTLMILTYFKQSKYTFVLSFLTSELHRKVKGLFSAWVCVDTQNLFHDLVAKLYYISYCCNHTTEILTF